MNKIEDKKKDNDVISVTWIYGVALLRRGGRCRRKLLFIFFTIVAVTTLKWVNQGVWRRDEGHGGVAMGKRY